MDHRLRQLDFSDAPHAHAFSEMPVADLEKATSILLIGCNPREMPLLNHRLRKAVNK
ncbi:MAG: hypothetical protein IPH43_02330 [Xanthomonadales bacterium]|nr:hypothetical protein [Xanthomonadales bacterium]